MILPIFEGFVLGAIAVDVRLCIGYTSLRKYLPKCMEPMSNRNKITCGCKNCISSMLIQSYINKWRLSQLAKLDKLYINSSSTKFLEISKNDFIYYKNQIFPYKSHINLIECDTESLYHCNSPSTRSNIPKWDCILNCWSDFPRMNYPYLESS